MRLILIVIFFVSFVFADRVSILLQNKNKVNGPMIRVKDIAQVKGNDKSLVRNVEKIEICKSAVAGQTRFLSKSRIILEIHNSLEGDNDYFEVIGPDRIRVKTRATILGEIQIKEKVRNYLYQNMPWGKQNVRIEFTYLPEKVIVPKGAYQLKIENNGYDFIGPGQVKIRIESGDKLLKIFGVSFILKVFEEVVVTARKIKRKSIITTNDLTLRQREITRIGNKLFFNFTELVGKQMKRTIGKGKIIDATMVTTPPLIRKGDKINIKVTSGGISVVTNGIARQDGHFGQLIRVKNNKSKKVMQARIINYKLVQIEM